MVSDMRGVERGGGGTRPGGKDTIPVRDTGIKST